ncbi:MAG: 2-oxoacid:acceptor oxidoreductase family protein [Thermodesulfobacteriota bacterium]
MSQITQIRISGFGGQGVVLAGVLLGEAGVLDGKQTAGSNSYGAQARGSGCKSEIVFSEAPIDFPHLTSVDILLAMSQGAYDLNWKDVKEKSGLVLYDRTLITPKEGIDVRQVGLPCTEVALKKLKNKQVANIILLGALVEITNIVSPKAIRRAMGLHVSERFRALNLKALRIGMALGRQIHG